MSETTQVPPSILPTDEDELQELAALGLPVAPAGGAAPLALANDADVVELIAQGGALLRRIRQLEEERAITRGAMQKELELIERVYGPQLEAYDRRRAYLDGCVRQIAQVLDARGALEKKKTVKTAFGDFGKRAKAAQWKITDPDATRRWAEETVPEAVRITVQVPLSEWDNLLGIAQLRPEEAQAKGIVEKKREVLVSGLQEAGITFGAAEIPGVEHVEATAEWVVKPNLED